jgi:predicted nucleotidyltransferase
MPETQRIPFEEAWPAPTEARVQEAADRLGGAFQPIRIVVFGSYARGDARPGSDVDLLVVLPAVHDKREAAVAMRRVLSDLPVPHDVYVTTPDEMERRGWIVGTLLHAALQEGKTVYERSDRVTRPRETI